MELKEKLDDIIYRTFSAGMAYMANKMEEDPLEFRKKKVKEIIELFKEYNNGNNE